MVKGDYYSAVFLGGRKGRYPDVTTACVMYIMSPSNVICGTINGLDRCSQTIPTHVNHTLEGLVAAVLMDSCIWEQTYPLNIRNKADYTLA